MRHTEPSSKPDHRDPSLHESPQRTDQKLSEGHLSGWDGAAMVVGGPLNRVPMHGWWGARQASRGTTQVQLDYRGLRVVAMQAAERRGSLEIQCA